MPSDTTMNVNLSRDLYDFVKSAVKSGRYASASEVVRDALRQKWDELEPGVLGGLLGGGAQILFFDTNCVTTSHGKCLTRASLTIG